MRGGGVDKGPPELTLDDIRRFLRKVGASRGILFGSRARGDYLRSSDEEEFSRLKETSSIVRDAVRHGIEVFPDADERTLT